MISARVQPLSKVEETTEVMKEPFVFKFPQWQLVWTSMCHLCAIGCHWLPWVFWEVPWWSPKSLEFVAVSPSNIWVFHGYFIGVLIHPGVVVIPADPSSLMCNSGGFPWNARNPSLCGRTGKGWCLRNRQAHVLAISERLIGKAANFADWEWFNIC